MSTELRTPAFIALGSNISPEANLPAAIRLLQRHPAVEVLKFSNVWESPPVGDENQPCFCNAAIEISTSLSPWELKYDVLRETERQLKRVRDPANKNGPRTIDLDILLYGSDVVEQAGLTIPDPEIAARPFLAVPLAELQPNWEHPLLKTSLAKIAEQSLALLPLKLRPDINLQTHF